MSQLNPLVRTLEATQAAWIQHLEKGWQSHAEGKGNICWIVTAFPIALLDAFDALVYLPEADAALTAYAKADVTWNSVGESAGYSRDLCSYAKITLGKILGNATPEQGALPPPDFLVTGRTACTTFVQWFETMARHYDVPIYVLDTPYWDMPAGQTAGKVEETYFVESAKGLIRFMEEVTGKAFDQEKFEEARHYERQSVKLLGDIYELTKIRPTPASEWDLMGTAMLSFVNWRCRPEGLEVLRTIKQEVEERLAQGTPALSDEKHRLLFVSNPPWYKVHEFQQWAAERDAVFVISSIGKMFESTGSFEDFSGMCTALSKHWPNWNIAENVRWHRQLFEEWGCDGVVMMDNRACKPIAFPLAEMATILEDDLGIPCLRFEGNMADSRDLDEQKVREQFDAFIDLLEDR